MNTTTATAPATSPIVWTPERDKYGRSAHRASRNGLTVGMVVRLPKAYVEKFGDKYLSNDWSKRGEAAVHYHDTLAQAKARIEAL